jgi:hypothetical protein
MKIMNTWALIGCAALATGVMPSLAVAAPVVTQVTGSIAEGGQITISGSGFGTKSPAKPYLWAPMDGSINPSPLGVVTSWQQLGSMSYNPTCSATGGGCMQGGASNGSGTNVWTATVQSGANFDWNSYGQKTYVFRKSKRDFQFDGSQNVKIFRWWGMGGGGSIQGPNYYFATSNGRMGIEGIPSPYQDYSMSGTNLAIAKGPVNQWYTEELVFKSNSNTNTADADFRLTVNGGAELCSFPNTSWLVNSLQIKSDSGYANDGRMQLLFAVHMLVEGSDGWKPAPSGSRYWADDVYVDNTWARVVIGDSPVYANARHREIQIPYDWSSGSIGVRVNIQAFPASSSAYLFVVDANGVASPGFPLSQNRPMPPGGLVVN